jgi:hypothetical protein
MALVTKNFSDIITFTRASTGTFFNSAGVLTSAATNAPRFDYNPSTLAAQGLLIEEARTNAYPYSTDFSNSPWSVVRATRVGNATLAPDGTNTAIKLVEDTTASNSHYLAAFSTVSFTSGTTYTQTVFAKAAERTRFVMSLPSAAFTTEQRVIFDLVAGTATLNSGTSTFSITPITNGWYRCSMSVAATVTTSTSVITCYLDNGTSFSYTGDGTSGTFFWGAQLEAGAFPTSYIPTTTTALTRAADVASVNTLSPWYNASAGTIYAEFNIPNADATNNRGISALDDGSNNNRVALFVPNSFAPSAAVAPRVVSGGTATNPANSANFTVGTNVKAALTYGVGTAQAQLSVNGAAPSTANPAAAPVGVNTLRIGAIFGVTQLSGWMRRVTVYPRVLSAAELQAITA